MDGWPRRDEGNSWRKVVGRGVGYALDLDKVVDGVAHLCIVMSHMFNENFINNSLTKV